VEQPLQEKRVGCSPFKKPHRDSPPIRRADPPVCSHRPISRTVWLKLPPCKSKSKSTHPPRRPPPCRTPPLRQMPTLSNWALNSAASAVTFSSWASNIRFCSIGSTLCLSMLWIPWGCGGCCVCCVCADVCVCVCRYMCACECTLVHTCVVCVEACVCVRVCVCVCECMLKHDNAFVRTAVLVAPAAYFTHSSCSGF